MSPPRPHEGPPGRALKGSVAEDVGDDERADARIGERTSHVEHAATAADEPTIGGDLAGLRIETNRHPMVGGEIPDEVRSARAAVPITTRSTPASKRASAASRLRTPPPVCTGRARPPQWPQRRRGSPARRCGPRRGRRRDPAGSCISEGERLGDRIVAIDGLLAVVALVEPDALAVPEIDGGKQVHVRPLEPQQRSSRGSGDRSAPILG